MAANSTTLLDLLSSKKPWNPNTVILFEGPSEIDASPIVVLLSGFIENRNKKIGNMLQAWILRSDMHPLDAHKSGEDYAICGNCRHADPDGRTCYVSWNGPMQLYKSYKASRYRRADVAEIASLVLDENVRLGAYGDPAAVPFEFWNRIATHARSVTGYTHQWKDCDPRLAQICMASVDTIEEREQAKSLGFRTFRVRPDDQKLSGEFVCPASNEAGKVLTCAKCKACGGHSSANTADVTITLHGSSPVLYHAKKKGMIQ